MFRSNEGLQFADKTKMSRHGFTIVELLIVIVVIAILASITVIAFTGIQDRALNASRITAARQVVSLATAYGALNGSYPATPVNSMGGLDAACLGAGWPEMSGVPSCWNIYNDGLGPSASTFPVSDSVNSALETMGTLPNYPTTPIGSVVEESSGRTVSHAALVLMSRTGNSAIFGPPGYKIGYLLKDISGATECGIGGAIQSVTSTGTVRCVVHLPDL